MKKYWILKGVKILAFFALFVFAMSTAVKLLWNVLMPNIFNLPTISLTQALGLLVLGRLLTGGFRMVGYKGKEHWAMKRQMYDKWMAMTPDERERWKNEWRARCNSSKKFAGFKSFDKEPEINDQI